jgi:D-xylulose reductase
MWESAEVMYEFQAHAAGLSGSFHLQYQVHFWSHGGVGNKVVDGHPLVMGHEASGIVVALGSAVTDLKSGDMVAIEGSRPCRQCKRCKEGLYNLCPKMKFAASPPDTDGMLAKYFKIPADFCYRLPNGVALDEGVLVEPLAVAAHAVRMINVKPGQTVVVFGAGTIGVLSAAVAKAYGASKIVAVDLLDSKLEFAKRFNSSAIFKPDMTVSAEENSARLVNDNDLGLGADAVIEASGAESSVNTAIHVLRPGGSYVQTGLGKPVISFPILAMSEKELHCHGAFRYGPGDYETALGFLEKGTIPVKELITKIFPFEKVTEAWETTKRGEGIKNLIQGVQD